MTGPDEPVTDEGAKSFTFQDKRRFDPTTYEARGQAEPAPRAGAEPADVEVEQAESTVDAAVAELTSDLQRLHAEYANYRKRVERDRQSVRELAVANALAELLPVLDDVGRARAHGDLDGAFKSVAESLESTVARLGFERYGEPGDPFDPQLHEAISHEHSDEVDGPTCVTVFQPGYRYAGRVVRPAIVAVADPHA